MTSSALQREITAGQQNAAGPGITSASSRGSCGNPGPTEEGASDWANYPDLAQASGNRAAFPGDNPVLRFISASSASSVFDKATHGSAAKRIAV